jgi:PIN domain nuclease of toxin-antitoxin system
VNFAEVVTKLVRQPMEPKQAVVAATSVGVELVPLDSETAALAGELMAIEGAHGVLSLGDRCCIALAMRRGLPIVTGDREWLKLELDVELRMIR